MLVVIPILNANAALLPSVTEVDINDFTTIFLLKVFTISILDKVFSFTSVATESPIWEKRRQQIKKYSELLELPKPLILEKVEFLYNNFMEMKV